MRTNNQAIPFPASDASVNQTSTTISMNQVYGWSAQIVFTGSPNGTLSVQVSDDPGSETTGAPQAPTNWTTLANSSQSVAAAGTVAYNVDLGFYNWIRILWVAASGSGTIVGRINLKAV